MRHLVIIGAGPRGLSILERVVAACVLEPVGDLVVHLVDPHGPGGRVWRIDQSPELLMNTTAGDATLFLDDTVAAEGFRIEGPTLIEWAAAREELDPGLVVDDALAAEFDALTPTTSVSRRLYGIYLDWAFRRTVANTPPGVQIVVHATEAFEVRQVPEGELVRLRDGSTIRADAVALALGHVDTDVDEWEAIAEAASTLGGWTYIRPGQPAEQNLDAIRAGEPVIIRGLGLNFFDLMALLSLGRGGEFHESVAGELVYRASGDEPKIWVGARRGVPFKAKPIVGAGPLPPQVRRYPSDEHIAALHARRGDIRFDEEMWPWIRKEANWQAALAEVRRLFPGRICELQDMFDSAEGATSPDPAVLAGRFAPATFDYQPEVSGDPLRGLTFADVAALQAEIGAWIRADLASAATADESPVKQGDRAIGASRHWTFPLAAYGGLDGLTHRSRFSGWYESYANALAGGPPAVRLRQLVALIDAGVVRMLGAGMAVTVDEAGATATSRSLPGFSVKARALIEARLPDGNLDRTVNPLLRALRMSGRARRYPLTSSDKVERSIPALDVTGAPFRLVDASGRPNPRILALGVPVGPHVGTSLTAHARANSEFFRQTDAVALEMLALARGDRGDVAEGACTTEAGEHEPPPSMRSPGHALTPGGS